MSIERSTDNNAGVSSSQSGVGPMHRDKPDSPLRSRSLTLLGSSSLLVLALTVAPTPVRAACTTTADCYGELFTRGIVTFNADGSVQQVVGGGAGGGINETVAGAVSGNQSGVVAVNANDGVLNVATNGEVIGVDGTGIMAVVAGSATFDNDGNLTGYTAGAGTDLTVMADAKVSGGKSGIAVLNYGTGGSTTVTASGDVTGTSGTGINVFNNTIAQNLAVTAAGASGGTSGIYVTNLGTGATMVTASGDVTGTSDTGIFAYSDYSTTSLTVEADASVTGGHYGISAENRGAGATSVMAKGDVTGTETIGIDAVTYGNAANLAVEADARVSGGIYGISVQNNGTGFTSVTVKGDVTGTGNTGIFANNGSGATNLTVEADARVTGGYYGISAHNYGTGATSVTAKGDVTGISRSGIYVYNDTNTTDLTVMADGSVTGESGGIFAENFGSGATLVAAKGNVTGTGNTGIGSYGTGIYATNTGTDLTVTADAKVSGGPFGIYAWNYGTGSTSVTAKGDVTATGSRGTGISAYLGLPGTGDLTVTADAGVSGEKIGIYAYNRGSGATQVTAGAVTGTDLHGVMAVNGEIVTDPYGIMTGVAGPNGTDLTVDVAGASGGTTGILAVNTGTGVTSVHASGDVTGTAGAGIMAFVAGSVDFAGDGSVIGSTPGSGTGLTVTADANVTGGLSGIDARNYGTGATSVTASGDTTGVHGDGIHAIASGTNLIVTADRASGGDYGIYASNSGTGTTSVTAKGDVTGTTYDGIHASTSSGTDLTVTADAKVSGGGYGIYASNFGTGATSVTANGDVTGVGDDGIHAISSGAGLTITAAKVSGQDYGIYASNSGSGQTSVTANGLIQGGTAGIALSGVAQNAITIAAGGEVRNSSGLASDLAVDAAGGAAVVTVEGRMTGGLIFHGTFDDQVINKGTWTISGVSDFGAGTDVLTNEVSGMIRATGATRFDNLETLISNGLVTMQNGTAGNRIATSAAVTLAAGSTLGVDLNAAGAADGIDTAGTANISGSTLNVAALGVKLGRYTIVTTGGGLTGTFAAVTGTAYAFLGFADNYDSYNAYLDVSQVRDFTDAALTPNQRAAAGGTQSTAGNPLYDAVLMLPTDAAARAAFDQVSGEVHASAKTALIDDSRFVRNAAIDRIRSAFGAVGASGTQATAFADPSDASNALAYAAPTKAPSFPPVRAEVAGPVLWGQAFGSWGHNDGDGNAARLSRQTGGLVTGGDIAVLDTWRLGLMAGYSHTTFNARDRASSGSSDNYHVGVYGGTQWGNLGFRTGAAYAWHDIATNRTVAFAGFADNPRGDYSAGTAQVFGELGYGIRAGNLGIEPFVNAAYVNLHTDGFVERGGVAALKGVGTDAGVTFTTLGLHLSNDIVLGSVMATARGTLGWRHAFGDTAPFSTFALAGGTSFTVAGAPIAKDAAVMDAGLDFAVAKNVTLGIAYTGQFGGNAIDQSVRANFNARF